MAQAKYSMLMGKCWDLEPNQRPTFPEIVDTLKQIESGIENEKNLWGVV